MKTKIVIFGITGDLSRRKLIPALQKIFESDQVDDFEIIGVSRGPVDVKQLVGDKLAPSTSMIMMNLADPESYRRLYDECQVAAGTPIVVYLSVPPLAVTPIVRQLGEAKFNQPNVKLLLEKPFGIDEVSARDMIAEMSQYFDEGNIYRIDHFLAKEMAQNIVAFRAGNALFARVWNREFIEKIEVIASETIGIEGRIEFYEQTGALRDVLQGHLMQLLALVLTRVPDELDWQELPELRAQALTQLHAAHPAQSVRAQYDTYRLETNNDHTMVETYVHATLWSSDPTWRDVPLVLTTGKCLREKTTEVRIYFRKSHASQRNCLRFRIQPDEGVEIDLFTKKPGYDREFESQPLRFTYSEDTMLPEAYEQVLVDAIRSHKSSFASSQEILASWRVLQPLLDAWNMETIPLLTYAAGSLHDAITPDSQNS